MSDAVTASAATPDAIPRHCTRCDYALAGLPAKGVCPECGTAYDGRFIVLRGWALGASATFLTGSVGRSVWLVLAGTAFSEIYLAYQIVSDVRSDKGWALLSDVVWLTFLNLTWVPLTLRRFGESGPPAQLWLGESGYLIGSRREAVRRKGVRVPQRLMHIITWAAAIASLSTFIVLYIAGTVLALVPAIVLVMICGTTYSVRAASRRAPPMTALEPTGLVHPVRFTDWQPGVTVDISNVESRDDVLELVIRTPSETPRRDRITERTVKFRAAVPRSAAPHLRERVNAIRRSCQTAS